MCHAPRAQRCAYYSSTNCIPAASLRDEGMLWQLISKVSQSWRKSTELESASGGQSVTAGSQQASQLMTRRPEVVQPVFVVLYLERATVNCNSHSLAKTRRGGTTPRACWLLAAGCGSRPRQQLPSSRQSHPAGLGPSSPPHVPANMQACPELLIPRSTGAKECTRPPSGRRGGLPLPPPTQGPVATTSPPLHHRDDIIISWRTRAAADGHAGPIPARPLPSAASCRRNPVQQPLLLVRQAVPRCVRVVFRVAIWVDVVHGRRGPLLGFAPFPPRS